SRRLRTEDLRDPAVSGEIAVKMSRFHGMVMPFNKEPKWLFGTMEWYLKQISELTFPEQAQLEKLEQLRGYNLEQEMRSLSGIWGSTSPLHAPSGIWGSHSMLPVGFGVPRGVSTDLSHPFSRGFDLGNHFCEWVYNYTHDSWPFFQARPEHYPSRQQQLHFIRHYLSEDSGRRGDTTHQEQARIEEEMLVEIDR
ncbi:CHKB kinase, partial [Cnemophilus loriae]|nr:CHKB kinase [Cnemophilus loriae]